MKFSAQTTQNFNPVSFYIFVRGVEASLLIGLSPDHAGSVQDLARGIVFCSQARRSQRASRQPRCINEYWQM